jgi:glutaminyl-peptide cyclotransferase
MLIRRIHPATRWCQVWLIALGTMLALPLAAQIPIYDYKIINTYPHNDQSFTQGLLIHDGKMYEGTGRYGRSSLLQVDLESGRALRRVDLAQRYFGEGIAVAGDRLYQLTWRENTAFVYDLQSLERITSHFIPTEGWGLTWDGEHLILSDGSHQLYFLDPQTMVARHIVSVQAEGQPVRNLNELEYIDGEVWANVWMTEQVVRINPSSGAVTGVIDLSGLRQQTTVGGSEAVLNGIAWDADQRRLFVTGKLWANLFEIELVLRD